MSAPAGPDGTDQPKYRDLSLGGPAAGAALAGVSTLILKETPFFRLRLIAGASRSPRPALFLVPPLSGHFPMLLRDMVIGLLPDFRVALLDWANVRHVPAVHGPFGFDDNCIAIAEAIEALPRPLSVVALCQSGVPALAAVAEIARRRPERAPSSLVLIAAPVDPLANPTAVVRFIRAVSIYWYETVPIERVPQQHAGRGRWVYPARAQGAGLARYLARHRLAEGDELARKMDRDDGADPQRFPFPDLYASVMDLDARQFTENIDRVFLRRLAPLGQLRIGGRIVEPAGIRDTSLLTIEGALDDIAAPGQTSAAHRLCASVPAARRQAVVVPGCGHFGLFHGALWRESVLPVLRDHCLRQAGA